MKIDKGENWTTVIGGDWGFMEEEMMPARKKASKITLQKLNGFAFFAA